jgi:hypothetical protein
LGDRSQQRAAEKAEKMKRVVEERLAARKEQEISEVTLQPALNYTMNSRTAQKIEKKRKEHFEAENISIFDSLYSDAERYNSKRELERVKDH